MKVSSFTLFAVMASVRNDLVQGQDAICLNQADFDQGTKIITSPGTYKLCEDISFFPNGPAPGELPDEDAFDPVFDGTYSSNGYGLGFFSAIAIASEGVTINLNNHTIEQSAGHALMQRFFAVIELASSPFIPGVGPAQFVNDDENFITASDVQILGPGTIGRSSHHGIHGNGNTNVTIANVMFRDFEVAAVSLNKVDILEISGCHVVQNRHDVPVVGIFSAARFLRPYGKILKNLRPKYKVDLYDPTSGRVETKRAGDIYDKLIASIENVYNDVVLGNGHIDPISHPEEHHLFDNPFKVVDGPCYVFVVHGKGPAVGGQGEKYNELDDTATSSNIVIKYNSINNIKCWNNEVPALIGSCGTHGCPVSDTRGSIFQTIKTFDSANPYLAMGADGRYNGNAVSDMQVMVAQAILDGTITDAPDEGLQIGPNSINQDIINWAKNPDPNSLTPKYICNGDSMHHVIKGIIAIRVEDTAGFSIEGNTIANIENLSVEPFGSCFDWHIGASSENVNVTQSGNVRAISAAAVRGFDYGPSVIKRNVIVGALSKQANVIIGIDIQGDSAYTDITRNTVNLEAGILDDKSDQCIAARIREDVDTSVNIGSDNDFFQEVQTLTPNNLFGRTRNLRKVHAHMSGDIEWKVGGCPFANA